MPTTSQHALIRRTIREVWNEGRIEIADELFAADYVNHGGIIPDIVTGPEAIRVSVVVIRRAFPQLHISVDALRTNGDTFTLSWTARNGRPDGTLRGSATTAPGRLTGTTNILCVDGKIAESWTTWDGAAIHAALVPRLAA